MGGLPFVGVKQAENPRKKSPKWPNSLLRQTKIIGFFMCHLQGAEMDFSLSFPKGQDACASVSESLVGLRKPQVSPS